MARAASGAGAASALLVLAAIALVVSASPVAAKPEPPLRSVDALDTLTFLVAVNDTWGSCITTVRSPPLPPNQTRDKAPHIMVGQCDNGPLTYTVHKGGPAGYTIDLTFYSSVIEDASPPTCTINWPGGFGAPHAGGSTDGMIPGCYTMDSREGYHMTDYWFAVYDFAWGAD